jgi:hypothetical protein
MPEQLDEAVVVLQAIGSEVVVPDGVVSGLREQPIALLAVAQRFVDLSQPSGMFAGYLLLSERDGRIDVQRIG